MEISLESTQIRLFLKIGNAETVSQNIDKETKKKQNKNTFHFIKTVYSNGGLCDNKWHTLKILREGARLVMQVDDDDSATGTLTKKK